MKSGRFALLAVFIFLFVSACNANLEQYQENVSGFTPTENTNKILEHITPYTTGSNQEWALWALSQLDNSEEKIRLYNFLLLAHTYLMIYDMRDFTEEYYFVKNNWLGFLEEMPSEDIVFILYDENWMIDIWFPLDTPFALSFEEFIKTYLYFADANPQFFLNRIVPGIMHCDYGLTPVISISAYWAFADRRQETYNNIQKMFDDFYLQIRNNIDFNSQYYIVRYVYRHVIDSLRYNFYGHTSRVRMDMDVTILGYFSEIRETICKGYAVILMYLLNRLGIPTIDQGGAMPVRDEYGEIVNMIPHAWNIIKLYGNWYFVDATWEIPGEWETLVEYNWFLRGTGENNDSRFLRYHAIAYDMIYPQVSVIDFHEWKANIND